LFDAIVTSAATGYEKPHPAMYAHARELAGDADVLWMVGDNPVADVEGARRAGIPAVLVRDSDDHDLAWAAGLLRQGCEQ
jgi:putative hydrolase of the HAD superfamily